MARRAKAKVASLDEIADGLHAVVKDADDDVLEQPLRGDDNDSGEVEAADDRPVMDEAGDNVVSAQDDGLPEDPAEKLQKMINKVIHQWDTGFFYLDVYRDLPHNDSDGNRISGSVGRSSKPIDVDWIRQNYGGGTYRVYLRGPKQSASGWSTSVMRGVVRGIVVGGAPFVNNRRGEQEEGPGVVQGDRALAQVYERMSQMQRELLDATQRTAEEKASAKSSDVAAAVSLMRDLNAQSNTLMQAIMEKQSRGSPEMATIMGKALDSMASKRDPDAEARMQEVMRAAQQQSREEISVAREEAARERRDLREQYELREKGLRDEMERRERAVREQYEQRERYARDQLDEVRARAQGLELQVEALRRESLDARLAENAATLRASLAPAAAAAASGGLGNLKELASTMEQLKVIAPALGLGGAAPEAEPSQLQQVMAILNTEPAKRVGDGLKNLLGNIGSRNAPPPPSPEAAAAWSQVRAAANPAPQLTAGPRNVRRRPRAEIDTRGMAPGATITPPIARTPREPREPRELAPEADDESIEVDVRQASALQAEAPQAEAQQLPVDEAKAAQLILSMIEGAASARTTPATFLAQVTPMLGGPAVIEGAKNIGADAVIAQVEETAGSRMSTSARQLVRDALDAAV